MSANGLSSARMFRDGSSASPVTHLTNTSYTDTSLKCPFGSCPDQAFLILRFNPVVPHLVVSQSGMN